jgi:hypothetical protein
VSEEVAQVSVPNLPIAIKERLEREATKQSRSLASLLRMVLIEYAQRLNSDEESLAAPRKHQPAAA